MGAGHMVGGEALSGDLTSSAPVPCPEMPEVLDS
jgi:hypothetical protein